VRAYDLGASSYITKPATFTGLSDMLETLNKHWFEIVQLP
jgi:two-component system response regulator